MSLGIVASSFVVAGGGSAPTATLTIASGKVSTDLTAFPVRVDLAHVTDAAWWAALDSAGGNLRVRQGGSDVPRDLVKIDTAAKTGELFFKAPTVYAAAANVFTLEVVPGATAPAATDANGRNAVWSAFNSVYLGGSSVDRAGKRNSLTLSGSSWGSDGWLDCGAAVGWAYSDGHPVDASWTKGISFIITSITSSVRGIMDQGASAGTNSTREIIQSRASPYALVMWNDTDGDVSAGSYSTTGVAKRVHGVRNGLVDRRIYLDGVHKATDTTASQRPTATGTRVSLGASPNGGAKWRGKLNYAYVYPSNLSAAWIAAEYASWHTPGTFYSLS